MNNKGSKQFIAGLFIFVVGSLFLTFLIYPQSFDSFKNNVMTITGNIISSISGSLPEDGFTKVSIKELNKNPSEYLNKNLSISGTMNFRVGGKSLDNSDGYWVWLEDNCLENHRNYNYNSQLYYAKGMLLPPKQKEYAWEIGVGNEHTYRFSCYSPVD